MTSTQFAVETRVAYADVLAHLTQDSTHRLTPADSTTLVRLANGPGGYAALACATLHQFYPALGCGSVPSLARGITGNPNLVAPQVARLDAPHPNPAASVVTMAYALPAGQPSGRLLLCDLRTGKVVLEQALTVAQGETGLNVSTVPEGLYVCRLEVGGQALLTRKVAILH